MDVENIRLSVQFLSGTSYNLNCVSFTSREKVYLFTRLMFNEKKLNSYFFIHIHNQIVPKPLPLVLNLFMKKV